MVEANDMAARLHNSPLSVGIVQVVPEDGFHARTSAGTRLL